MDIEGRMKSAEAEAIIRFLGDEAHYGKEFTPYHIAQELKKKGLKTWSFRVKELLSLLHLKFPYVISYKHIGTYHLFWISLRRPDFLKWFKEWFQTDF